MKIFVINAMFVLQLLYDNNDCTRQTGLSNVAFIQVKRVGRSFMLKACWNISFLFSFWWIYALRTRCCEGQVRIDLHEQKQWLMCLPQGYSCLQIIHFDDILNYFLRFFFYKVIFNMTRLLLVNILRANVVICE